MLTGVLQRTSMSLRGLNSVETTTCTHVSLPKMCDSYQTSFPCEFLTAYSEDTAKAARELAILRTLFL
jgi:hypothetical protein